MDNVPQRNFEHGWMSRAAHRANCGADRMIFSNLVGNAFKYTPPSGSVTLAAAIEDGGAVVTVQDEGEGIPQERLRTSSSFQRATSTGSGLGVGLAVVHALVVAHGGTVTAASEGLGRGATFTVRLPLAAALSTE
jgi:signal transduction histidine kinase